MKKFFVLSAIALCSVLSYGIGVEVKPGLTITEKINGYQIDYSLSEFQVVTDTIYDLSNDEVYFSSIRPYGMDQFDHTDSTGLPTLPFYSTNLILPTDASNVDVTVTSIDTVELTLPYDYTPAQGIIDYNLGYSYDVDYYTTTGNILDWVIYTIRESRLLTYNGLTFSFFPCYYEPVSRKLTVIIKAQFEVTYSGSSLSVYTGITLPSGMDVLPFNFYDNFKESEYPFVTPPINGDEYLIIAAHEWYDDLALLDFIDHKENLGYNVTLEDVTNIGNTAEAIRTYIRAKTSECDLRYVLLVGNITTIPFSYGIQANDNNPPTDMFYSCLSEADIEDQWEDLSPTVYVGRWAIETSNELSYIVNKTINSDMYLGGNDPRQISMFSGNGGCGFGKYSYNTLEYVYDLAYDLGYARDLYDGRTLSSSAHYTLTNRLSSDEPYPTWMFVYAGNGAYDRIGAPYNLTSNGMDSVATEGLPFQPFGFGFAPYLGNAYYNTNFAMRWVSNEHGGGVTFLGATTDTYREPDRYFCHMIFDQLEGRPIMTIGELVANAKVKYANALWNATRRREAKKYVLYGDPSLYLYGLDFIHHTPHAKPARRDYIKKNDYEITDDIQSVSVYSISGQLLLSSETADVNYSLLPAGVYLMVTDTENQRFTRKIIVK